MSNELLESLRWKKFPVLNDGYICLTDVMGSEKDIIAAARISYGKDARGELGTELASDEKTLLRYLFRNRHNTPFEMAEMKFIIRAPIFVFRQWHRHRTQSYNEYSGRYSVMIDSMETVNPDQWRVQSTTNKQGSGIGEVQWPDDTPFDVYNDEQSAAHYLSSRQRELHEHMTHVYQERLKFGVSKEQARIDLPVSNVSEMYAKCDISNLMHFLSLRSDGHAQVEIRSYADVILYEMVKVLFPNVYQAFIDFRLEAMMLSRLDQLVCREMQKHPGWHFEDQFYRSVFELVVTEQLPEEWSRGKRCRERDECYEKLGKLLGFIE
jgi:thymidylate synthase (FAD)